MNSLLHTSQLIRGVMFFPTSVLLPMYRYVTTPHEWKHQITTLWKNCCLFQLCPSILGPAQVRICASACARELWSGIERPCPRVSGDRSLALRVIDKGLQLLAYNRRIKFVDIFPLTLSGCHHIDLFEIKWPSVPDLRKCRFSIITERAIWSHKQCDATSVEQSWRWSKHGWDENRWGRLDKRSLFVPHRTDYRFGLHGPFWSSASSRSVKNKPYLELWGRMEIAFMLKIFIVLGWCSNRAADPANGSAWRAEPPFRMFRPSRKNSRLWNFANITTQSSLTLSLTIWTLHSCLVGPVQVYLLSAPSIQEPRAKSRQYGLDSWPWLVLTTLISHRMQYDICSQRTLEAKSLRVLRRPIHIFP